MAAFLSTLLRLSLLGSALAGMVCLLKRLLGEKLSRRAYYYLWVFVLLRLCVPVGVTLPVPVPEAEHPFYDLLARMPAAPPSAPDAPDVPEVPDVADGSGAEPGSDSLPAAPDLPNAPEPPAAPEAPASLPVGEAVGSVLVSPVFWTILWAAGALIGLGRYVAGYRRFAGALLRTAGEPSEEARKILRTLDPQGRVGLVESPAANAPLLMGLLRPVIVLPPGITDAARLGDILAHEYTHARRLDLPYKWWAAGVGCLHWFNPAVYLVRREMARACELSCDEAVVQKMPPDGRRHYGETLLALAAAPPAGLLAVTMCEEKKHLKERLVSLARYRKSGPAAAVLAAALALAVGGCALIGDAEPTHVPEGEGWKALVESFNPNASPVPENVRWKAVANPSDPQFFLMPEDDITLFEAKGFTMAFYRENYDQLLIFSGDVDENGDWVTLVSVYEKQSYEESMADSGIGAGFLFSITRSNQAQYEQYLMSDGSGQTCFARDDTYYYFWNTATDVQFYRSGITDYSQADFSPWSTLEARLERTRTDFIARNGLTAYSSDGFFRRDFTYDGEHRYVRFVLDSHDIDLSLELSQPVKKGEGGIWCVERYVDNRHGEVYYSFAMETPLPQDRNITAAEHYQTLQDAADRGERPDLLDPLEAARIWLKNCYHEFQDETLDRCTTLLEESRFIFVD